MLERAREASDVQLMDQLIGRVAVIIGATNATGIALAERAAREAMCVVLADPYPASLTGLAARLTKAGAEVLAIPVDVSNPDDVAELARRAVAAFGAVHLLFNNSSLVAGGLAWDAPHADWDRVLSTSVWSVVHALNVFVPMMIEQGGQGHIVNTSSLSALLPLSPSAPHQVSSAAVVSLTEHLDHSLQWLGSSLRASVLCAGWALTRGCPDCDPEHCCSMIASGVPDVTAMFRDFSRMMIGCGLPPTQVADAAFAGVAAKQLYIVPNSQFIETARARLEAILGALPPR